MNICEVCGSSHLEDVLDLGDHPLCDDLKEIGSSEKCKEYPIKIKFCDYCKTAFQSVNVVKTELFSESYHYRSRFTADVISGMHELAGSVNAFLGGSTDGLILDIGCNDGSLLDVFNKIGYRTCGVEPTGAIEDANSTNHILFNEYFDETVAKKIKEQVGFPRVITFTNVFAHIENLPELLKALKILLGPKTLLVIENHYLGAVLKRNQFDTFYHEHPRTYSLSSFTYIAEHLDLSLLNAEFPSRYGGNIRVVIGPQSEQSRTEASQKEISEYVLQERHFKGDFNRLRLFIDAWKISKKNEIMKLISQHGKLSAKAFPGRAAILVKLLELDETHIEAVYEKPGSMKIGHYVPGTNIPIGSDEALLQKKNEVILNLAWHISDEISEYLSANGVKSKIIDIL